MLFNSVEFLLFSLVVFPTYFILPVRLRWILLLAASVFFYGFWKVEYLGLIFVSAVTDFFCASRMATVATKQQRKPYLWLSLTVNLGILLVFKYFNFFVESINQLVPFEDGFNSLHLILPMGISFYTFQTIAYTVDVYRDRITPERNFGIFSLYVTFFPQLVAGPIERASQLIPQLRGGELFNPVRVALGFRLMLWGLFKKVVVADRLATFVDPVYLASENYNGSILLLATVFFAIQIYCDFSGYSDMAIGLARMLGVDLMRNFRTPYFSASIGEFWSRWHISLSTWFRDYLYIPLGGNRAGKLRWNANIFIVFLVSGLWHGANWTFVVWGALHGTYLLVENVLKPLLDRLNAAPLFRPVRVVFCFVLVLIGWVFFRASDVHHGVFILNEISSVSMLELKDLGWILQQCLHLDISSFHEPLSIRGVKLPFNLGQIGTALIISGAVIVLEEVYEHDVLSIRTRLLKVIPFMITVAVLLLGIVLLGFFESNEFIYFQF